MSQLIRPHQFTRLLLLAALALIVHAGGATKDAQAAEKSNPRSKTESATGALPAVPEIGFGVRALPAPVAEMRAAILTAAMRADIRELKYAIDLNELKPDFDFLPKGEPIAGLRKYSVDGNGLSILAALSEILQAPHAVLRSGRDIENNKVYVWPYLAEMALDKLTPAQKIDLFRLASPESARAMLKTGKWRGWRLAIGADGVWHSLRDVR